ncbi:SDR family NAD(P)-dependent oxidoreductase [Arthrobacter sp. RT-1]|uniref:SDR family NAD(P)-dependent oxidoreductase n=1 Tax=Arthrobacter sp. RT-1 TaxID=2292263 RepID=UPI000E1F1FB1|nr:SDR family NAD(P)-dependent oxidoreductase [Arthrobacter sp. RT-1]RDV08928.1 SDR family NAD(P)-dependent oxidoreductase [Arthrobacter sp. RT-1]
MVEPVAIVTGASAGIGFEAARKLAGNGFAVYAGARRVDRMDPLKPLGVTVLPLDVTDDAAMRAAVGRVRAERGRIEVLVSTGNGGGACLHQQGQDIHPA